MANGEMVDFDLPLDKLFNKINQNLNVTRQISFILYWLVIYQVEYSIDVAIWPFTKYWFIHFVKIQEIKYLLSADFIPSLINWSPYITAIS